MFQSQALPMSLFPQRGFVLWIPSVSAPPVLRGSVRAARFLVRGNPQRGASTVLLVVSILCSLVPVTVIPRIGCSARPSIEIIGSVAEAMAASQPSYDPRILLLIGAIGMLVIVVLGFLVVRGCTPKPAPTPQAPAPKEEPVGSSSPSSSSKDDDDDSVDEEPVDGEGGPVDDSPDDADSSKVDDTGTAGADGEEPAKPKPTKVRVSLKQKDAVAWIEVKLDGKSVLAAQEVGPFSQEFIVTERIEITTDKPSDVLVSKNGKKVRYDTKVPGLAKVSIEAPKPPEPMEDPEGEGDSQQDGNQGSRGAAEPQSADTQ